MIGNEKVLYKEIVDSLKEIMGVNDLLPRVAYGRLKQFHTQYGMTKLHEIVTKTKDYLATRISANDFDNEIHMWWYIDKAIRNNIDLDDLDEYIL